MLTIGCRSKQRSSVSLALVSPLLFKQNWFIFVCSFQCRIKQLNSTNGSHPRHVINATPFGRPDAPLVLLTVHWARSASRRGQHQLRGRLQVKARPASRARSASSRGKTSFVLSTKRVLSVKHGLSYGRVCWWAGLRRVF